MVIPCEWERTRDFSEGLAAVFKDSKWGFIDTTGKLVIPCEWDGIDSTKQTVFYGGFAHVEKDDKWGIIDTAGTLVVPCEYDDRWDLYFARTNGCLFTLKDNYLTIVDKDGNRVF